MDYSNKWSFQNILLQVTNEKLIELKTQKNLISEHFTPILQKAFPLSTTAELEQPESCLRILHNGICNCPIPNLFPEILIQNVKYFLREKETDPSISNQIIQVWIGKLKEEIEFVQRKCEYSFLYGNLLTEWLEIENKRKRVTIDQAGATDKSSAEVNDSQFVDDAGISKEQQKDTTEDIKSLIFAPLEDGFNRKEFLNFLSEELFATKDEDVFNKEMLNTIKKETKKHFDFTEHTVNAHSVSCCIDGLCSEDFLPKEKKLVLKELKQNSDALNEVASFLSNRIRNLQRWSWPEEGLDTYVKRGLAGQYRAFIDEEILTSLFLQYVGVYWASYFKSQLLKIYDSKMWNGPKNYEPESIEGFRQNCHRSTFLSMLPDSMENQYAKNPDEYVQIDSETIADSSDSIQADYRESERSQPVGFSFQQAQMMPPNQMQTTLFGSSAPIQEFAKRRAPVPPPLPKVDMRQTFLHILSTEIVLSQTIYPESPFVILQADFERFNESLRHEAILATLKFFGVPKPWLEFFKKYLETPIKFGLNEELRIRRRGIPDGHVLSSLFGELVLFCLDFNINQTTEMNVNRVFDNLWLWNNDSEAMVKTWNILSTFGGMLGLKLNEKKCGSITVYAEKKLEQVWHNVGKGQEKIRIPGPKPLPSASIRWAYLELQSTGLFSIDELALDSFIKEMNKLLNKATCTLEFVNIYNKYMVFFLRNFGKNALIFGNCHIDQILSALKRIHKQLFETTNGNVVQAMKTKYKLLQEDSTKGIVDIWFYWPLERGGLGLVNPFLEIMALSATYNEDHKEQNIPSDFNTLTSLDKTYWEREQERVKTLKAQGRLNNYNFDAHLIEETFAQYCAKRERKHQHWYQRFIKLLERPTGKNPPILASSFYDLTIPNKGSNQHLKWLFSFYEPQLLSHFGTVEFINTELLPMSMIANIQKTKVQI